MKKRRIISLLLTIVMLCSLLPTVGVFATEGVPTGSGTAEDPYAISTKAELLWYVGLLNGTLDGVERNTNACAKLEDDIILNSGVLKEDGTLTDDVSSLTQWTRIESLGGTLDGQGHTIRGLYLSDSQYNNGMVSALAATGCIKNLSLVDAYVKGGYIIGGLCAEACGVVDGCYVQGRVEGVANLGLIAGGSSATIKNSYCEGTVSGNNSIGGLVGHNDEDGYTNGYIENCYAAVTLNHKTTNWIGGLCGNNTGIIVNSYSHAGTYSGRAIGVGVDERGESTMGGIADSVEVRSVEDFSSGAVAYALNSDPDHPIFGQTIGEDAYPVRATATNRVYVSEGCRLYSNDASVVGVNREHTKDADGICTQCHQYVIATKDDLFSFADYVRSDAAHATTAACLADDITLNTNVLTDGVPTENTEGLQPWTPLDYSGTFDGQGHTIYGLYVNSENGQGFFKTLGTTETMSVVKDLHFKDAYVSSEAQKTGILAGINYGLVTRCSAQGRVDCTRAYVGGLIGESGGFVSSSRTDAIVCGEYRVGGLIGNLSKGSAFRSYSFGTVSGSSSVGGLVGYISLALVSTCYSGAKVRPINEFSYEIRGLVGSDDKYPGMVSNVENSYSGSDAYLGDITTEYGTVVPPYDFYNGKLAYLLNGNQSRIFFGQTLGTDAHPVLANPNNTVYMGRGDCVVYTNDPNAEEKTHDYQNGLCKDCGAIQLTQPKLIDGVYQIGTVEELYWFSKYTNSGTDGATAANAELTADITVNENLLDENYSLLYPTDRYLIPWTPICDSDLARYSGTFDGKGHTISGLYIDEWQRSRKGLIGEASGACVKNLGIRDSYIYGGYAVGGICGSVSNTQIINCFYDGVVEAYQMDEHGSLVGYDGFRSYIANSYAFALKRNGDLVENFSVSNTVPYINSYYLSERAITSSAKDPDNFMSGEVAYLLSRGCDTDDIETNEGSGSDSGSGGFIPMSLSGVSDDSTVIDGSIWGQELGKDTKPTLNGKKVYATEGCVGYSNDSTKVGKREHVYDADGNCEHCGKNQMEPEKIYGVYQIGTVDELYWFAEYVNRFGSASAALTQDIVVNKKVIDKNGNPPSSVGSLRTWQPIGTYDEPYEATFDGQGHTIRGLYADVGLCENARGIGFFGSIGYGATVKNLGIEDSVFKSVGTVGGITCYITGDAVINNCMFRGVLVLEEAYHPDFGGIVGYPDSFDGYTVVSCYAAGDAYREGRKYPCPVTGFDMDIFVNCYYLGADNPNSSMAKSEAQFRSGEVAYLLSRGATLDGSEGGSLESIDLAATAGFYSGSIWGQEIGKDAYPVLSGKKVYATKGCVTYSNDSTKVGDKAHEYDEDGFCKYCDASQAVETTAPQIKDGVYQISNAGELVWFRDLVNGTLADVEQNKNANAVLTRDIVVQKYTLTEYGLPEIQPEDFWIPMNEYGGTFDGQGHTISGLCVLGEEEAPYVGAMFRRILEGGCVKNLHLKDTYINGSVGIGGLCGQNEGTIQQCSNDGNVFSAYEIVGGICGILNGGVIEDCFNQSTVSGFGAAYPSRVGGIVGKIISGTVQKCLNVGEVYGVSICGGVAGDIQTATLDKCMNYGDIYGLANCIGGIYGQAATRPEANMCFYYENCIQQASSTTNAGIDVAKGFFTVGTIAIYLQNGREKMIWGQDVVGKDRDPYPILTSDVTKKLYDVTLYQEGGAPLPCAANADGIAYIPVPPSGYDWFVGDEKLTMKTQIIRNGECVNAVAMPVEYSASLDQVSGQVCVYAEKGGIYDVYVAAYTDGIMIDAVRKGVITGDNGTDSFYLPSDFGGINADSVKVYMMDPTRMAPLTFVGEYMLYDTIVDMPIDTDMPME